MAMFEDWSDKIVFMTTRPVELCKTIAYAKVFMV